jgi:hypothetical protein
MRQRGVRTLPNMSLADICISNYKILCVYKHKSVNNKTIDDGVEQKSRGTLCLKDRSGNSIDLGGGNDKKEKSGLQTVNNTGVHYKNTLYYFFIYFINMKR